MVVKDVSETEVSVISAIGVSAVLKMFPVFSYRVNLIEMEVSILAK
jgi:hypothetical protein